MKQLVTIENRQAVTDSRTVAEIFGKQHQHVMRDIRDLFSQAKDASKIGPMFAETTYADKYGREKPMYLMNRDGFSLLAMGFTGQKALQFKLKFIDAFNRMEQTLKQLAVEGKDPRWIETRRLGKIARRYITEAIKALEDYFKARGKIFPKGYLYGHFTKLIQSELGIAKGSRDSQSVKKLNQLDQTEDMAGNVIFKCIAADEINSLIQIDRQILSQIRKLNELLSGGRTPLLGGNFA